MPELLGIGTISLKSSVISQVSLLTEQTEIHTNTHSVIESLSLSSVEFGQQLGSVTGPPHERAPETQRFGPLRSRSRAELV